MKKVLAISSLILLAGLFLHACGLIPNSNTSFVTITIGDGQRGTLHAEKATTWSRFKYFLADAKLMSEAHAYIPSVVQVLVVTVTAADITAPIVGVDTIAATDTVASIRIEVPNGNARQFLVEGIRGLDSQVYFRGTASSNLMGADVNLPVSMSLVGPGFHVNFTTGTDTPATTGTSTNPFKTITYALTRTTGTDAIYVAAGTHPPAGAAAGESYPLQLHRATAVLCTGANFSTVLNLGSVSTTAVWGDDRASIDNCKIRINNSGGGGIGIYDAVGGQPLQQSRMRVNGMSIELSGSPTGLANIGVIFSYDSLLLESSVTGSGFTTNINGVQVRSGQPQIIGNTIASLPRGIDLAAGAGDALIQNNTMDFNQYGIWAASSNKPKISSNVIRSGNTGIFVSAGSPQITGNDISGNSIGIDVEIGAAGPVIQANRLYCNTIADLFTNITSTLDLRNNAWDHDPSTIPSGPTEMISFNGAFGCSSGADVCYQGAKPSYLPSSAAVAGGCLSAGKPLFQ